MNTFDGVVNTLKDSTFALEPNHFIISLIVVDANGRAGMSMARFHPEVEDNGDTRVDADQLMETVFGATFPADDVLCELFDALVESYRS